MVDTKKVSTRIKSMATTAEPAKANTSKNADTPAAAKNGSVRGRQKKVDMAYTIGFLNEKNEDGARIPTNVHAVQVVDAAGKKKVINLKDIPSSVLAQLAADGIRKKLNFFLKDVTKANLAEVHSLTDEFIKVAKDATLYIPKEGGGPGRSFDFDFWIAVMEKASKIEVDAGNPKAKLMTDKVKAEFRTKMESWTPQERTEKKKQWEQRKAVKNAIKIVQAERVTANLGKEKFDDEDNALSDLF